MKKTTILIAGLLVFAFLATACGQKTETPEETQEEAVNGSAVIPDQEELDEAEEARLEAEEEMLKFYEETDEQRAAEEDLLNELVSDKQLKAEDCEVLEDPEFKAGCLAVAERSSVQ